MPLPAKKPILDLKSSADLLKRPVGIALYLNRIVSMSGAAEVFDGYDEESDDDGFGDRLVLRTSEVVMFFFFDS